MTLKPQSSQPVSYRKIKVWTPPQTGWRRWFRAISGAFGIDRGVRSAKAGRSDLFRSRWKWRYAILACLLGALTAVVQSLVLQLANPALAQQFNQTIAQTAAQAASQTAAWVDGRPPVALPQAISGLSQPRLWAQSAKLASHLGHLPYQKPDPAKLALFPSDPPYMTQVDEYLHQEAVAALKRMMEAAQTDGISLFLVSGFRDLSTQAILFQNRSAEQGTPELAAKSVAPPGYSEHHTGYAVDLADGLGDFLDFEQTPAFRWMMAHAYDYGFELSFPLHNPQGVDYEPWHWRFVRSPAAANVFVAARGKL